MENKTLHEEPLSTFAAIDLEEPFEWVKPLFDEYDIGTIGYAIPRCAPTDLETFRYEPLSDSGHIRLLKIHAQHRTDLEPSPIVVELQSYDLNEAPEHFTLSYTWGRPARHFPEDWNNDSSCRSIVVNGKASKVRPNLFHALTRLRLSVQESYLWWVDAICINQQDVTEKGSQIKLMAKIFTKTQSTFGWLGPPDSLTTGAVRKIDAIAALWD